MKILYATVLVLGFGVGLAFAQEKTAGVSGKTVMLGDPMLFKGVPGTGPLSDKDITTWLATPGLHDPLQWTLPMGLDAGKNNAFVPDDNPITLAKIELGRQLYFDPRLSSDSKVSCASCHDPAMGFGANTRFGVGIGGAEGGRNSPVSYNRILSRNQFWDGRGATLEDQAIGPIANPIEMGNTHDACVACLAGIPGYALQFKAIFSDGVTINNVGKALATFERAIVTGPTPYDYYAPIQAIEKAFAGDLDSINDDEALAARYAKLKAQAADHPMSESAKRGMALTFGKANCTACHAGANFTDELYHNLGVGMDAANPDLGRYEISKEEKMRGAFKTPTMRNVALSPPYMHDGSQASLEEVIAWYNKGGHPNPYLSDKIKPLNLTAQEQADLIAFMKEGLASPFPSIERGRLPQ
jgi:cytochrome c peroxidase